MTSRAGLRLRATRQIVAVPAGGGSVVLRRLARAAGGDAVAVVGAEAAGRLLGQRVAVALAVGGADEGRDDVEVPLGDLPGLAPEVGETEVDVELEEVDPGRSLGHGKSVGGRSDGVRGRRGAVTKTASFRDEVGTDTR